MSLLFNMLSRFVIAFLPRGKHLLISWLQSLSTVILEPKKIKLVTVSIFSRIYLPESHGQRSLVGVSPWGCNESDMTKQLTHTHTHTHICHGMMGPDAMIFSSVQFSSVIESCLTLCEHAKLPCPSPAPGPCSNSCPLSQ